MKGQRYYLVLVGVVCGLALGLMLKPLVQADGSHQIAPWLEVVHRVCTSIGGLGTFGALIFVARQFKLLRWQSELLQKNVVASMDSALYTRLDSFNRFIVDHHELYELLDTEFNQQEAPSQRAKLHHLCDQGFTFYEEIYKHHHRYQLLSSEDWSEWNANMRHFFGKPYVLGYWKQVSTRYTGSFQKFVNSMYHGLSSNHQAE